jgi:large subunit ribosomal protein L13
MKVINGENLIVGRAATYIAKQALLGEEVALVNCSQMVITGSMDTVLSRQNFLADLKGRPTKGRFYFRNPDLFVKRTIRGMLPKSPRGREAFRRVKCYTNIPEQFTDTTTIEQASVTKVPNLKYVTVGAICKKMGGSQL